MRIAPLRRDMQKRLVGIAGKGGLKQHLGTLRKMAKRHGLELPTGLKDMTLEQRKEAVKNFRAAAGAEAPVSTDR